MKSIAILALLGYISSADAMMSAQDHGECEDLAEKWEYFEKFTQATKFG